jgi:uncharacterized protein YecA (UPF0149 family)
VGTSKVSAEILVSLAMAGVSRAHLEMAAETLRDAETKERIKLDELKQKTLSDRKGRHRNRLCPCGSNKKFKHCCWLK